MINAQQASTARVTCVGFATESGIAAILPIARDALAASATSQFLLFCESREAGQTPLLEEMQALKDRYLERLALHVVMTEEPQELEIYNGRLDGAKVQELARCFFEPTAVADYFIAGAAAMREEIAGALSGLGVERECINRDAFSAVQSDGASRAPVASESAGVEVTVVMDGRRRTFTMRLDAETILDAAAGAGVELPFSCKAGVCSTCRTKLVRGKVELAQNYALEDWELEQGYILACQARAKTPVLELNYDEK